MIELAAAPRRVSRTWSVIGLCVVATGDVAVIFIHSLTDLFQASVPLVASINAGAALVIVVFRFLSQDIPVTPAEKASLIEAVKTSPTLIEADSD